MLIDELEKEIKELEEKQTAKIPRLEGDGYADGFPVYDTWHCPSCGLKYEVETDNFNYCPNCGQKIDWSK